MQNLPVLPAEARALYEKHAFADTNPSMDEVLSVLSGEIAKRSVVSILIDAIDECPSSIQKTLFRNIQGLFSMPILQKTQIRLIVTSCLSQSPFPDAEYIELLAAEGDVGLFVRETIAGGVSSISPTLSSLVQADPELQAGIVNAVVSKAKGM